jgi:5-methyltetrahydropteroyltriglutamate--homocysteine methyltransferase
LLFGQEKGLPFEPAADHRLMAEATTAILARQHAAGVDIPSEGETSKTSDATYIKDRLTAFEGDSPRAPPQDLADYPGYLERLAKAGGTPPIADRAASARSP